jgi:hypothetical protein
LDYYFSSRAGRDGVFWCAFAPNVGRPEQTEYNVERLDGQNRQPTSQNTKILIGFMDGNEMI